jgi:hypothetical protein
MTKQAKRPRVGDECWFVEWTYELFWIDGDDTSEYREIDRDRCKDRTRQVASKEDAERVAKEVWPETHDTFGVVEYWPARFIPYAEEDAADYPHAGFWETIGEVEVYEGPEGGAA